MTCSQKIAVLLLAVCFNAKGLDLQFVPGRILVKPRPKVSEKDFAARLQAHGAIHIKTLQHINVRLLRVDESRAEAMLSALRHDPGIEYAERDGLASAVFVPNDPYVLSGQSWHLARIQAQQAWDYTFGSSNVIVAILDSGINAAHPDLAGRVLPGYDFVGNDADTSDSLGHGTAVAGVVGSDANNGIGAAGVAFGCKLLPVKVVDTTGFASYSAIAEGLRYATDQGAKVVNMSIAGSSPSSTLQDAINYAWSNNVVVVAAAGNNANSNPEYPAACDNVVAVSATEPDDTLASFSSYGNSIALAAPGDGVWTTDTDPANPYAAWRGTSFASPVVAGVAALVISANSTLSNTQIVSLLEQTADDIGPAGYDQWFGYGRVNAFRAVTSANPNAVPWATLVAQTNTGSGPGTTGGTNPPPPSELVYAPLVVQTNGVGRIAPNLNGILLQIGQVYRIRAVPGPGQIFAGWNGTASQSPVLTFSMQSNLNFVANFVPTPFAPVKGAYAGLIADANGVAPASSGYFTLAVTGMGQFTGRLRIAGVGYGFHGQLDLTGNATVSVARGALLSPLRLSLQVDLTGGTDVVVGSITDGGWASHLTGDRNVFNAQYNPAQQAGLRSFVLSQSGQTTDQAASAQSNIALSGATHVRGRLSSGSAFGSASWLSKRGDFPFYLWLNRNSQVVIGWLNFPAGQSGSATGTVIWAGSGTNSFASTLQVASVPLPSGGR